MLYKALIFLSCLYAFAACKESVPGVDKKKKFHSVIDRYRGDSLKSAAARFLIDNMDEHYTIRNTYKDLDGRDLSVFISAYKGELSNIKLMDSLGARLIIDTIYDVDQVTPEFLIKNIDDAFDIYNNSPFHHKPPLHDFFEYVLPYRVKNEELHNWRAYMRNRYGSYIQHINKDSLNIYYAMNRINIETFSWFWQVSGKMVKPSNTLTVDEILRSKIWWTCHDISTLRAYLYRSLGIPAAFEMITAWGKFNGGHYDGSISLENNRFYPAASDTTWLKYCIAKMYRETFSKQETMWEQIKKAGEIEENIPQSFDLKNCIDVTRERTTVGDISFDLPSEINPPVFYICVYDYGTWVPIHWAKPNDTTGKVVFNDLGRKVIYQLAYSDKRVMFPIGSPVILDTSGKVRSVNANFTDRLDLYLNNYNRHAPVLSNNSYDLFYWDSDKHTMAFHSTAIAKKDGSIEFKNAPSGAIYKLEPSKGISYDVPRIFTYENKKQVWW